MLAKLLTNCSFVLKNGKETSVSVSVWLLRRYDYFVFFLLGKVPLFGVKAIVLQCESYHFTMRKLSNDTVKAITLGHKKPL